MFRIGKRLKFNVNNFYCAVTDGGSLLKYAVWSGKFQLPTEFPPSDSYMARRVLMFNLPKSSGSDHVAIETAPEASIAVHNEASGSERILRVIEIVIPPGKTPERLDVFLTRQVAELTRSKAQALIETGGVTVNGASVKASRKVHPGDVIRLQVMARPPLELAPEPIPLEIVWEDEWLLVINKPAGLVVHPAAGNRSGTLVNALLAHYKDLPQPGGPERPGLVHRLDKNTSGLMVVCKREPALSKLAAMFRDHKVHREYHAIAWWRMPARQGQIDAPLGRDPRDRKKYAVREGGKPARTRWNLLETFDFLCHLALRLETGRTHQIRVHLSHEGHPVFGDPDYGGRNRQMGKLSSAERKTAAGWLEQIRRQMLHAATLGFTHPITRRDITLESPLPDDFQWLLAELRALQPVHHRKPEAVNPTEW